MSAPAAKTRQQLVQLWLVQMIGTLVLMAVVLAFARNTELQPGSMSADWKRYLVFGILAAGVPALAYLRHYKRIFDQDVALERQNGGVPHAQARATLTKALALGGALCELPMAVGVAQLLFGGETRWFLGATLVTIGLRLSYRPFDRKKA